MIDLIVPRGVPAARTMDGLADIAQRFSGDVPLAITVAGYRLELGPAWRYSASDACLAALGEFGDLQDNPTTTGGI